MAISSVARLGAAFVIALIGMGPGMGAANADDELNAQLDALRQALAKYEDPYVAVRDLYLSTVGCVHYDGTKMDGYMYYPKGAMGVHFVNLTIQGPPDPMKPNVLIYEPEGGQLRLVAAEWLVPLAAAKERPSLFVSRRSLPESRRELIVRHSISLGKRDPAGQRSPML
jgi:hypothetical protein